MVLKDTQAELMFGQSEVLVPVIDLLDNESVTQIVDGFVEYFHILFDQHEIIHAEGTAYESFHPADYNLTAINDTSRSEIFALFPDLRLTPNAYGPTARTCLKAYEGQMIGL